VWKLGGPVTHLSVPEDADGAVACLLAERGMDGTERYIPGRELLYTQVPRAVGQMPAVRVVDARLPGLAALEAVMAADDADEAVTALTTELCRPMRGVCAGMASRKRPRSAVVGAAGPGSAGAVVAWAVRKTVFVWDTARRRLHRHGLPRLATSLCVSPTAPDDVGDVGAFADPVVTVGDVEGQLVDIHCLGEAALGSLASEPAADEMPSDTTSSSSSAAEGRGAQAASVKGKGVSGAAALAPSTSRHWHAHAAAACARSADGASILSGGEEATLVRWDARSGSASRTFLPRLGAPVRALAESSPAAGATGAAVSLPPLVAIGLADCSLIMVDAAASRVLWRVRGLAMAGIPPPLTSGAAPTASHLQGGLAVDPRTGCVAVSAFPGRPALQLFDARHGRHAADVPVRPPRRGPCPCLHDPLRGIAPPRAGAPWPDHRAPAALLPSAQIVARNFVSRADGPPPPEIRVSHAAFSPDGRGLVTAEYSTAPTLRDKPALRFWAWSASGRRFVLSTKVDEAHRGSVSVLLHHPTAHAAVSAASARTFKVWQRRRQQGQRSAPSAGRRKLKSEPAGPLEPAFSWTCRSVGFWRDEPVTAGAWSGDGSLLALAYGSTVTLWQPLANTLRATLSKTAPDKPYLHLAMPPGGTALIAATATELQCWDLVSGGLSWAVQGVAPLCLAPEPAMAGIGGTRFAAVLQPAASTLDDVWGAASARSVVAVWDPKDAKPCHVWRFAASDDEAADGDDFASEPPPRVSAVAFLPPPASSGGRPAAAGRSVSVCSEDASAKDDSPFGAELAALTDDSRLLLLRTGPDTSADSAGDAVSAPTVVLDAELAAPRHAVQAPALALGTMLAGTAGASAAQAAAKVMTTGFPLLRPARADAVIAAPVHTLPPPSEFAAAAITAMLPLPSATASYRSASGLSFASTLSPPTAGRSVSASPPFAGRFGSVASIVSNGGDDAMSLSLPPAVVLRPVSASKPSRGRRASSTASSRGTSATGVAPADALAFALLSGAERPEDELEDAPEQHDGMPGMDAGEPDLAGALAATLGASIGARATAAVSGGLYLALGEANREDAGAAWGLRLGITGRGRASQGLGSRGRSSSRASTGSDGDASEGVLADGAKQAALRQFTQAGASLGMSYVKSRKRSREEGGAPGAEEPSPRKAKADDAKAAAAKAAAPNAAAPNAAAPKAGKGKKRQAGRRSAGKAKA